MFHRPKRQPTQRSSSHSKPSADHMTEPLAFGERIYRSFPAPLIDLLLHKKGVGRPTAVVESVEGSTGIPGFEGPEFDDLMRDMDSVADRATVALQALIAEERGTGSDPQHAD
jgi:hypothetical protein